VIVENHEERSETNEKSAALNSTKLMYTDDSKTHAIDGKKSLGQTMKSNKSVPEFGDQDFKTKGEDVTNELQRKTQKKSVETGRKAEESRTAVKERKRYVAGPSTKSSLSILEPKISVLPRVGTKKSRKPVSSVKVSKTDVGEKLLDLLRTAAEKSRLAVENPLQDVVESKIELEFQSESVEISRKSKTMDAGLDTYSKSSMTFDGVSGCEEQPRTADKELKTDVGEKVLNLLRTAAKKSRSSEESPLKASEEFRTAVEPASAVLGSESSVQEESSIDVKVSALAEEEEASKAEDAPASAVKTSALAVEEEASKADDAPASAVKTSALAVEEKPSKADDAPASAVKISALAVEEEPSKAEDAPASAVKISALAVEKEANKADDAPKRSEATPNQVRLNCFKSDSESDSDSD